MPCVSATAIGVVRTHLSACAAAPRLPAPASAPRRRRHRCSVLPPRRLRRTRPMPPARPRPRRGRACPPSPPRPPCQSHLPTRVPTPCKSDRTAAVPQVWWRESLGALCRAVEARSLARVYTTCRRAFSDTGGESFERVRPTRCLYHESKLNSCARLSCPGVRPQGSDTILSTKDHCSTALAPCPAQSCMSQVYFFHRP